MNANELHRHLLALLDQLDTLASDAAHRSNKPGLSVVQRTYFTGVIAGYEDARKRLEVLVTDAKHRNGTHL